MDELLKALAIYGPGGVLAGVILYMWKCERDERRESQTALNELGKRSIEADFTVAKSMDGLSSSINTLVGSLSDSQRR